MTMTGLDSKKMNPQSSFQRTHQQEHNAQLVTLLYQLKESLEKLPSAVVKEAMDTAGSALASAVASAAAVNAAALGNSASSESMLSLSISSKVA